MTDHDIKNVQNQRTVVKKSDDKAELEDQYDVAGQFADIDAFKQSIANFCSKEQIALTGDKTEGDTCIIHNTNRADLFFIQHGMRMAPALVRISRTPWRKCFNPYIISAAVISSVVILFIGPKVILVKALLASSPLILAAISVIYKKYFGKGIMYIKSSANMEEVEFHPHDMQALAKDILADPVQFDKVGQLAATSKLSVKDDVTKSKASVDQWIYGIDKDHGLSSASKGNFTAEQLKTIESELGFYQNEALDEFIIDGFDPRGEAERMNFVQLDPNLLLKAKKPTECNRFKLLILAYYNVKQELADIEQEGRTYSMEQRSKLKNLVNRIRAIDVELSYLYSLFYAGGLIGRPMFRAVHMMRQHIRINFVQQLNRLVYYTGYKYKEQSKVQYGAPLTTQFITLDEYRRGIIQMNKVHKHLI